MKLFVVLFAFIVSGQNKYSGHSVYRFNNLTGIEEHDIKHIVRRNGPETSTTVKKGKVDVRNSQKGKKEMPKGNTHGKNNHNPQNLVPQKSNEKHSKDNGEFTDSYHSLNEIYDWMKKLQSSGTFSAGKTYEGRDIQGIKFGSAKRKKVLLVQGGIHAREWISPASVVYVINAFSRGTDPVLNELLKTFEFQFIPVINGDGYEYSRTVDRMWRKNRQPNDKSKCVGTDLNRNFDFKWKSDSDFCSETYPGKKSFSAPESNALAKYIKKVGAIGHLDVHSFGEAFMRPYSYTCDKQPKNDENQRIVAKSASDAIFAINGRRYKLGSSCKVMYEAFGTCNDWAYGKANIKYPYTVELPDTGKLGFDLPTSFIPPVGKELLAGLKEMAKSIKNIEKL